MALTKPGRSAGDAGWCVHWVRPPTTSLTPPSGCSFATASSSCEGAVRPHRGVRGRRRTRTRHRDARPNAGSSRRPHHLRTESRRLAGRTPPHLVRLDEASPRIAVGKFLGAVGTGAAQGEVPVNSSGSSSSTSAGRPARHTQVVGRDRYIEYVHWMGNTATTCQKVLTESETSSVRNR